jgi:hypothetical protein
MAKLKYQFNPLTLKFDIIRIPFHKRFAKILIHLVFYAGVFLGLGYAFSMIYDTPVEQSLKRDNAEFMLKYELAQKQIFELSNTLATLEAKDNNIYRLFLKPIPYLLVFVGVAMVVWIGMPIYVRPAIPSP